MVKHWVVMQLHEWKQVETSLGTLDGDKSGTIGFLPVFETREKAVEFAGEDTYILEVEADG